MYDNLLVARVGLEPTVELPPRILNPLRMPFRHRAELHISNKLEVDGLFPHILRLSGAASTSLQLIRSLLIRMAPTSVAPARFELACHPSSNTMGFKVFDLINDTAVMSPRYGSNHKKRMMILNHNPISIT